MRQLWAVAFALAAAVAALAVALGLAPGWAESLGLDPEEWARLAASGERGRELDAALAGARRRLAGRQEAVEELLAGRLTLVETAARFRDLDRADPPPDLPLPAGASEEERYCRAVIVYVRVFLRDRPAEAEAAGDRLEGGLSELLRRGELRLPA